jgi:hypothetical protein
MKWQHRIAVALTASLLLAGCGGESTELKSVDAYLKETTNFPKVRPDGRLTDEPRTLTEADVNRQPANSPARAVMRLWYFAQIGNPSLLELYEPAAQRSVGLPNLLGAYSLARSSLAVSWPRVVQAVRGDIATTVDVLAFTTGAAPGRETFVLRRQGSKWRLAYDSLLAKWLETYVQGVHDAGAAKPSPAGQRAGSQAAKAYRDGFVRTLEGPSRDAFLAALEEEAQAENPTDGEQPPGESLP